MKEVKLKDVSYDKLYQIIITDDLSGDIEFIVISYFKKISSDDWDVQDVKTIYATESIDNLSLWGFAEADMIDLDKGHFGGSIHQFFEIGYKADYPEYFL